jgi:hypothetical protein
MPEIRQAIAQARDLAAREGSETISAAASGIIGRLVQILDLYVGHEPTLAEEAEYVRTTHRAEVLAEAKTEVVAWLAKKATEQPTWDASVLASKVDRGAVRAFLGTGHYRDAMDAHRAEVLAEAAAVADKTAAAMKSADETWASRAGWACATVAVQLRRMANGKDTGAATPQAPAGESTQPALDADDDRVMRTVRAAIEGFSFDDYGLDYVDPRSEYAEWVGDLASAITGALGGETA